MEEELKKISNTPKFNINLIPESEYERYNINPEDIKNELLLMSYGYKSNDYILVNPGNERLNSWPARLSLEEQPDGSLNFMVYPRHDLMKDLCNSDLTLKHNVAYKGAVLSDFVRNSILITGNAGRLLELETKSGEKELSFLSYDKKNERMESIPASLVEIPKEFLGVKFTDEQNMALKEGRRVIINYSPKMCDTFQYNAIRNSLCRENKIIKQVEQEDKYLYKLKKFNIPKKIFGVLLSKNQRTDLKNNKAIFVKGMIDPDGNNLNSYVKVSTKTQQLLFYNKNPDNVKERKTINSQVVPKITKTKKTTKNKL